MKLEELLAIPKTRELINLPHYGITIWSNSYPYGYPNSRLRINSTKQVDYYVRLDDGDIQLLPPGKIWEMTNLDNLLAERIKDDAERELVSNQLREAIALAKLDA